MIKIGAVFIPVTDIDRAVSWYKDILDLEHVGTWPDNEGADFYFRKEEQYLTLVKVQKKDPLTFTANTNYPNPYFNFTTSDLEGYHKTLQSKGVKVSNIEDHGPIMLFNFYDPDGNKFDVVVDNENYSFYSV
ncbi:VOC family protein [Radiobacillus deserti]|uniref:VOC family protein n=1 Tax=Radiobacillus deserti TaxID=2594883 RepID=UPI0013155B6A|nr:VOC family protein [Radiobacillus deserti]